MAMSLDEIKKPNKRHREKIIRDPSEAPSFGYDLQSSSKKEKADKLKAAQEAKQEALRQAQELKAAKRS